MKLSREEVLHLAVLVRLGLSDEEVEKYREQLSNILENFEVLQQVDTTGLSPTAHSIALGDVMREDEPGPCMSVDEVLANAPNREDSFFRVKPVLE